MAEIILDICSKERPTERTTIAKTKAARVSMKASDEHTIQRPGIRN